MNFPPVKSYSSYAGNGGNSEHQLLIPACRPRSRNINRPRAGQAGRGQSPALSNGVNLLRVITYPTEWSWMPCGISILPYYWIDDLSTEDASPSPVVFMRAIEFFINHFAMTTRTLHFDLPLRFIRLDHFKYHLVDPPLQWNEGPIVNP